MQTKRFTKNDNRFTCINCGAEVEPLGYTSRDHCNRCLYSVHVDIMPGDRANECGGNLIPVSVGLSGKKGFIINYKCEKCGLTHRNKAATDDNQALLIKLTNPYETLYK